MDYIYHAYMADLTLLKNAKTEEEINALCDRIAEQWFMLEISPLMSR